jgi:hypothetical protein
VPVSGRRSCRAILGDSKVCANAGGAGPEPIVERGIVNLADQVKDSGRPIAAARHWRPAKVLKIYNYIGRRCQKQLLGIC